jgi:CHAD domain-containing protein
MIVAFRGGYRRHMARATSQNEREVELAAPSDLEVPDLREVVGGTERMPEQLLTDAYFDTGDLRLWRRGILLRHRLEETPPGAGGGAGLWTLELPPDPTADACERPELRWVGDRTDIPVDALTAVRAQSRRERVEMVTELVTVRRRLLLRNAGGEIWAEVDDDTTAVHHGPQDGLTFRRLKVELVGASENGLDPVIAELRHAGARRQDEEKLGKILGAGPSEIVDHARDGKGAAIGAVVTAAIASGLDRLLDHDVALRLDPFRPPVRDVHGAHVATRRLRADLKTFAPVLDPLWVRHTRAELKSVGKALGRVRDADVLTKRLGLTAETGRAGKGMLELAKQLGGERDQAAAALAELIGSDQYVNLLDRLHAASERPPLLAAADENRGDHPGPRTAEVLPSLVHEQWRSLRRRVRKAGNDPSDDGLHRIRIAAKQLRYAAELSESVVGKPARRTARSAKSLQDSLGDHHDMVAAEAWLRITGEALNVDPSASFTAGLLSGELQRDVAAQRGEWQAIWKLAKRKENRRWMR